MDISNDHKNKLIKMLVVFLVIVSLYFVMLILSDFKSYRVMGNKEVYTVVLSGHGEVTAVPDVANVSFTISKDAKTVKEAQEMVAKVEKLALDFLKENKVSEKDIKTSDSSFYPKYEYKYGDPTTGLCNSFGCTGKNVIVGYTATETIAIKIRNIDDAGKIIQGLGSVGVSNLNGPNFVVDKEDSLKMEARKEAILDAREKAKVLAKDLGVRLGRVTSFSEVGDYGMPMYALSKMEDSVKFSAPAILPKGENTIISNVTVTYEIR